MNKTTLLEFKEIDITPENFKSCELIGFNREDNRAKGILDRLKAQIAIFQTGVEKYCIITIDNIGFSTELTNILRSKVAGELDIGCEEIMVCFSHSHSTPDGAVNNGEYFNFVLNKIIESLDKVGLDLVPIKAAITAVKSSIGVNRRENCNIVENDIGLIKIENSSTKRVILLVLRVTAHANVLTSDNLLISADYIGETRKLLEEKYNCKVMITQGASGDIKPKYRQRNADLIEINPLEIKKLSSEVREKCFNESIESLKKIALEIYKSVDRVFDNLISENIFRLKVFSKFKSFSATVPRLEKALEILSEAKKEGGIDGTEWFNEVRNLNEINIESQIVEKEIQFFVINNGCLCGIPDEPMCEIGLNVKAKTNNNLIFFGGYTNGYEGYLATEEEYEKGGYEVLWSNLIYFKHYHRVMPLNKDSANNLVGYIYKELNNIVT